MIDVPEKYHEPEIYIIVEQCGRQLIGKVKGKELSDLLDGNKLIHLYQPLVYQETLLNLEGKGAIPQGILKPISHIFPVEMLAVYVSSFFHVPDCAVAKEYLKLQPMLIEALSSSLKNAQVVVQKGNS